jgi:sucrose-6-phosphate hydrolase SacC (GH32 family)
VGWALSDLKTWKQESRFEGFHECPELFELPVDGDLKNTRWVIYAAAESINIYEMKPAWELP